MLQKRDLYTVPLDIKGCICHISNGTNYVNHFANTPTRSTASMKKDSTLTLQRSKQEHGRYIVGFGLVEMAISTNPKPTIYRNLYENMCPSTKYKVIIFFIDLHRGVNVEQRNSKCKTLCPAKFDCCDTRATCSCDTYSGKYACLCHPGYYGTGLKSECLSKYSPLQR